MKTTFAVLCLVGLAIGSVNACINDASTQKELSTFFSTLESAHIAEEVNALESVTIFVPTNDAFTNLHSSAAVHKGVLTPDVMGALLLSHIIPADSFNPSELVEEGELRTALANYKLAFTGSATNLAVTSSGGQTANVLQTIDVCGSTIYVIDAVLTPSDNLASAGDVRRSLAEISGYAPSAF